MSDDKCPECGEEYEESRLLTQGEHKHKTNFLRKVEADSYCISFGAHHRENGVKVYCQIYLHQEEQV